MESGNFLTENTEFGKPLVCVCTLIMGLKLGISVMMGSICMDHRSISVRSMEGCVLVLCSCV